MTFFSYLFHSRRDNRLALSIWALLSLFYIAFNWPYVSFMSRQADQLVELSPFYKVPFTLNLFNFDPSMYYGYTNVSVIHPLLSLPSGLLASAAAWAGGNLMFLSVQSAMNAASAVMIFYYLRRSGKGLAAPLLWSVWFGVSSYTLFTSLIPDSYAYAEFFLILSVLYLQYIKAQGRIPILPVALLAAANFGITSTNLITFLFAFVIMTFERPLSHYFKRLLMIGGAALGIVAVLTFVQAWTNHGISWIHNWGAGLANGGFKYMAPFSLMHHWKIVYMLFIHPVLTPATAFMDPNLVAFATDLHAPLPWYVSIVGCGLMFLALLGFMRMGRSREGWMLAGFILFALWLHIGLGFGLEAFEYDMYLYAGHFLFALFLLGGRCTIELKSPLLRRWLLAGVGLSACVTLVHNAVRHAHILAFINAAYANM